MGVIKSSNLCCEITIYSDSKEFGTCVLGSICLPKFITDSYAPYEDSNRILDDEYPTNPVFDYEELARVAGVLCRNLDNIIDKNMYPCEEAKRSSMRGRPIGIGVQGLADVFYKFKIPFDSADAKKINKKIFEAIYYGAISMSTKIAKERYFEYKKIIGNSTNVDMPKTIGAYPAYLENGGSPLANGKFTWEMYGLKQTDLSGLFDWDTVRNHVKMYGVRNSLLTALMPTASTSHINGNVECFEPLTSNMYKRKVLSGEFIIINKYMVKDLQDMGLWTEDMINYLKVNGGSVQGIEGLPLKFKSIYRNVWEIPQKVIMDLCIDRQPFIDQSQSMNLFFQDYTYDKFSSSQFYAWNNKLKTGSYYIRTQASVSPQKFTVNPNDAESLKRFSVVNQADTTSDKSLMNAIDNLEIKDDSEICLLCSA
jgi:ribonucleoside-diphosphate reductase alpha subunit